MKTLGCALVGLGLALAAGGSVEAQDVQQKAAAAKQAAAANQQALRAYTWTEKTEIVLKGEVKNTKLQSCVYGGDGKVIKTPVPGAAPAAAQESGGRRGGGRVKSKVVEKKTGEMKAEMEAAAALVHQYVPPAPDKIQAAMAASKISVVPGTATTTLRISDYVKPGDALVLTLGGEDKGLKQLSVDSWMDQPSDKVTLKVQMQSLPDGTDYAGNIVLSIPSSNIEVRITNGNYQKLAQ